MIADPVTYGELLDAAFSMLRRAAREYADVLLAMLETIAVLAAKAPLDEQRHELARQARLVELESEASSCVEPDKARVSRRCAQLLATLEVEAGLWNR